MTDDVVATVHRLLSVRVWFEGDDGQMRPSKAGLALKVDKLPGFASAVSFALEKAREQGLVQ